MRLRVLKTLWRFLLLAASFRTVVYGDDITIPLDGGSIVIGAAFHKTKELAYNLLYPDIQVYDLVYSIRNQTDSRWRIVRLRFDFGGLCTGRPKQWSIPISVNGLPQYSHDFPYVSRQFLSYRFGRCSYRHREHSDWPEIFPRPIGNVVRKPLENIAAAARLVNDAVLSESLNDTVIILKHAPVCKQRRICFSSLVRFFSRSMPC
jgi:hypothetical protein